jgi:hypothetical protein
MYYSSGALSTHLTYRCFGHKFLRLCLKWITMLGFCIEGVLYRFEL